MIDYVTLMLVNMSAGFVILGIFILGPFMTEQHRGWSVGFMITGLIAAITGFTMTFTWPLPSPYNIAFGEMSVLLGLIYLGAGLSIAQKWDLMPVCVYAIFAGIAAIVVGARFINLGLSNFPLLSGIGFILPGICGICSGLVVRFKKIFLFRLVGAVVLFISAGIWLYTGYFAYWSHLNVSK